MKIIQLLLILTFSYSLSYASGYRYSGSEYTRVFYNQNQLPGWKASIVGRVISISATRKAADADMVDHIQSNGRVTVRLFRHHDIREGDELFVINKTNQIVSRIKVTSVFKSTSFGYMLSGNGNFKLSVEGDRVVRRIRGKNVFDARVYVRRGDYFMRTGNAGKAIAEYKKAVELDRDNPEAHFAMGKIYLKQKIYPYAAHEFMQAYKNLSLMYDNQDKYDLLVNFMKLRFAEVYYSNLPSSKREEFRTEGIKYAVEAVSLNKNSVDANYYLALFYYNNPNPREVKARDHLLRVIELNPEHTLSYIYLGKMYYHHNNTAKARAYIEKALTLNPKNRTARNLLDKIDRGRPIR